MKFKKKFVQSSLFVVAGALLTFAMPDAALAANPTVNSLSPADDATGVAIDTNLIITFDQTVIASGSTLATPSRIRIFTSNGTSVENITASGSQVTVSSATVTINPSVTLSKSTNYYIQIEAQAFVNASDESYAGISDASTWSFRTVDGGGAAARQLRERLMENVPDHYDKESPCLADVGIFDPDSTCKTGTGSTVTEEEDEVHKAASAPAQPAISTELKEERRKRSERLMRVTKTATEVTQKPSAPQYSSNLHRRACERVENRFSGNQKMIDRVNARLDKRFGFTCDVQ